MFDRPIETSPRPASTGETEQGIEQVCELYDGLLDTPSITMSEEDEGALAALAGVYDIDARRPNAEVWRDLRAVLTRQPARASEDAPAAVEPAREPLTLLLVEDDPETAADLTAVLSEAGHNVVGPFHQAEAAEAAVALHNLDLALLDINLSGAQTGADLARVLKSRWGLPVMFLTGDLAQAAAHADLSEALILKPYSGRDVLEALAAYQASQAQAKAGSSAE
jgi:CheY-like chemotaxis protein